MNSHFQDRLFTIYPHPIAIKYSQAYDLIASYNSHPIDDAISLLIHLPDFDDLERLPTTIRSLFSDAMYDILVELLILPSTREFNSLFNLLRGMRLAEDTLDSAAILDVLERQQEDTSPEDVLASVLQYVDDGDWMELRQSLRTVTPTVIRRLYDYHDDKVQSRLDEVPENVIESRLSEIREFFKCYNDTSVGKYIHNNILQIPSDDVTLLQRMTSLIYTMDDFELESPEQVAIEIVAMAMIMPIASKSVMRQAKIFVGKLFNDPNKTISINTKIDTVIKRFEAFRNEK